MSLDMGIVGVYQITKDTAHLAGLGFKCSRAFWTAYPPFQRQMQRLLVSLPVMLCTKGFLHVSWSAKPVKWKVCTRYERYESR